MSDRDPCKVCGVYPWHCPKCDLDKSSLLDVAAKKNEPVMDAIFAARLLGEQSILGTLRDMVREHASAIDGKPINVTNLLGLLSQVAHERDARRRDLVVGVPEALRHWVEP